MQSNGYNRNALDWTTLIYYAAS